MEVSDLSVVKEKWKWKTLERTTRLCFIAREEGGSIVQDREKLPLNVSMHFEILEGRFSQTLHLIFYLENQIFNKYYLTITFRKFVQPSSLFMTVAAHPPFLTNNCRNPPTLPHSLQPPSIFLALNNMFL